MTPKIKKTIAREGLYIILPLLIMSILKWLWLDNENGLLYEFGHYGLYGCYLIAYSIRFIIWAIKTLKGK
jgi:hypothetical protein